MFYILLGCKEGRKRCNTLMSQSVLSSLPNTTQFSNDENEIGTLSSPLKRDKLKLKCENVSNCLKKIVTKCSDMITL